MEIWLRRRPDLVLARRQGVGDGAVTTFDAEARAVGPAELTVDVEDRATVADGPSEPRVCRTLPLKDQVSGSETRMVHR